MVLAGVVGVDDVLVLQLGGDFYFLIKPSNGVLGFHHGYGQDFDRDLSVHDSVTGQKDGSHSTLPQLVQHDVITKVNIGRFTVPKFFSLIRRNMSVGNEFRQQSVSACVDFLAILGYLIRRQQPSLG